jgi:succinate dehydrogenase/fumarate reductase flavoprotein subunit
MLKKLPGVFVAGEMLDYDAPTGGYLLQAAFATGLAAGRGAARYLGLSPDHPVTPLERDQSGLSPRQEPNGRTAEASNKYSV